MNTHDAWSAARAALCVAASALVACGGARMEPLAAPASAAAPAEQPAHDASVGPDEALAQLDSAEGELARALGQHGFASPPPDAPDGPAQAPRPTVMQSGGESLHGGGGPCATACRALGSMGRSAEHLCGLVGEEEPRCEGARARVKSASSRVQAQCPGCAGG